MSAKLENGRLFDLGYYPMLIETGTDNIIGRVMHVKPDQYDTVLANLDKLEGYAPHAPATSHYRRELRTVTQADDTQIEAWVYIGHESLVRDCPIIPNGDWHTYSLRKLEQVQQSWHDVGKIREDL